MCVKIWGGGGWQGGLVKDQIFYVFFSSHHLLNRHILYQHDDRREQNDVIANLLVFRNRLQPLPLETLQLSSIYNCVVLTQNF